MNVPSDWEFPQWSLNSKVPSNWHNYTSIELRNVWETFSAEQKQIIASCLNEISENEEWD